jgi:Ran-binding protein 1
MSTLAEAEIAEISKPPVVIASELEKPSAAGDDDDDDDGVEAGGEDEGSTAVFRPLVSLEEVEVVSGEEGEDTMFKLRGKLYRYTETLLDKGSGKKQWIERGVGEIKLLK